MAIQWTRTRAYTGASGMKKKKNKTSSNRGAARDITASIEVVLSNSVHYFPTEIFRWGMGTNHMLKEWW